ncbi:hypothetical protein F5Y12DRAFT_771574 [Xylaria sp. FL1777]|nr:hypothetical protein F5Y12DRAFT_771574 [Xylaria sp. FL1777]
MKYAYSNICNNHKIPTYYLCTMTMMKDCVCRVGDCKQSCSLYLGFPGVLGIMDFLLAIYRIAIIFFINWIITDPVAGAGLYCSFVIPNAMLCQGLSVVYTRDSNPLPVSSPIPRRRRIGLRRGPMQLSEFSRRV